MQTPLDQAHALMEAAPADAAPRLRFYERLAACELFLLLDREAANDRVQPMVFPLEGGRYVLAFDSEARLAEFTGRETPFVAMSGRQLAHMLAGQGMGLGVNLKVAPSAILLPPDALAWLGEALDNRAAEAAETPVEFTTPFGVDSDLMRALDAKFAAAEGLADRALLAGVRYANGQSGLLLALVDTRPGAEGALRQSIVETVSFSATDQALDIAFLAGDDARLARLARVGLRFDLPKAQPGEYVPAAPGMDPDKPPKLR